MKSIQLAKASSFICDHFQGNHGGGGGEGVQMTPPLG